MPRAVRYAPVWGPILFVFLGLLLCSPAFAAGEGKAGACSDAARKLRASNDLVPVAPAGSVLASYFVGDETGAAVIYGPVSEFVAARKCPTAWLIESGEKARLDKNSGQAAPFEYTLVLEEDCPGRVAQYSFVFLTSTDPKAWLAWREQFHKSKTAGHYGQTMQRLGKAAADGYPVSGDLRYLSVNGELSLKPVEESLKADTLAHAVYDLSAGRALAR